MSHRNDDELLKEIVKLVLMRLGKQLVNSKGLVGIDKKIADLESLIRKEPKDTCLIGIWGIGSIGKTTLVQEVFNKLRSEFQGSCFLANEREQSSKDGLTSLKNKIFEKLLGHVVKIDTPNSLPNDSIRRMKVLIVLDDVNDSDHLEKLLGTLDDFGSGSRIMITTRDEQVLNANKADDIYQLREFNFDKALELFKLNAFNQSDHQREYDELSKRMVNYAKGIPLVLKVLARLLRGKNKEVWESELDKLKKMPLLKVYDIMKLSYDDLDCKEQQIFLDLACFFVRSHTEIKVGHLKLLLRDDEKDNSVVVRLERLKDKALVTFSEDNFASIHDSLQEMAWEIVRRESIEDPGKHSRLWDSDDIYQVLKNDKGTESIRSILLHLPTIKKKKLRHHIFAKMSRLRFLEISVKYIVGHFDQLDNQGTNACWPEQQKAGTVEVPKFLATDELRFLSLESYPLNFLQENFSGKKLVILKLESGEMEKLWDGVKNLVNLKELDHSWSMKLKELPDLSKATNLEVLLLKGCTKLTSVHPSIFSLAKLETLDLYGCMSLTVLTSNSHLCSLSYLNLEQCENLTEFSVISENMKELRLNRTKIKNLPSSFGHQGKLKLLSIERSDIERLPSSFRNLTQLLHLELLNCSKLQTIPKLSPILETLEVSDSHSLLALPKLPMSLKTLNAKYCDLLLTLPELPPSLETLEVSNCYSLLTLPELPMSLKTLNALDCKSLKTVLFPSTAVEQLKENRKQVQFWNCLKLDKQSQVAIGLNARINMMKFADQHLSTPNQHHVQNDKNDHYSLRSGQAFYVYPGSSVPEWLEYKTTTEDYIIIDLSSAPPSPRLGFIFCFVFGDALYRIDRVSMFITISDGEGEVEGEKHKFLMEIEKPVYEIESSNQMCVIYDQSCSDFFNSRAKNQTRFKIQVAPMLPVYPGGYYYAPGVNPGMPPLEDFKEFGVSPISSSTYKSFIQQMELHDSMSQFH